MLAVAQQDVVGFQPCFRGWRALGHVPDEHPLPLGDHTRQLAGQRGRKQLDFQAQVSLFQSGGRLVPGPCFF